MDANRLSTLIGGLDNLGLVQSAVFHLDRRLLLRKDDGDMGLVVLERQRGSLPRG